MSEIDDYRFQRVGVCLPPELRARLQGAAHREMLPVSTFCRLVLAAHLDAAEADQPREAA